VLIRCALLAVLLSAALVACRSTSVITAVPATPTPAPLPPASPAAGAPAAASPNAPSQTTAPDAAGSPPPAAAASPAACRYAQTRRLAEVQDRAIKEGSALAASQRWPGVYWTLNDSGNPPIVFAVDEQGRARGTFQVDKAENVDWEALQVGPGRDGGSALYVGDIGDNDGRRRELAIYRVPEPEPAAAGARAANGRTAPAETFKIMYPAGARDAEALLVHPTTGEILIVTKEIVGRAVVFRLPLPLDSRRTVTLERIADLDLARFGVRADVVTDAAVSPDGRRVTVRTYGSGLEYDVPEGAPLASIWGQTPRVFRIDDPPQGEGISYRTDGSALLSIGEGLPAYLYLTPWAC
jgi:hypothetical protein